MDAYQMNKRYDNKVKQRGKYKHTEKG